MKGLLFYDKNDVARNADYIKWFMDEAGKEGIKLELVYSQEFFQKGLNKEQTQVDFVINRSRNYELALSFELKGIRVMNSSKICLLGNNKLAAYNYVQDLGIKIPETFLSWYQKEELISKKVKGHGGAGVEVLISPYNNFHEETFQQQLIKDMVGDLRFYIINNKIVHSVLRRPKEGYISNFSQGGSIELYHPSDTEKSLVGRITDKLHIDYGGIDFLLLQDGQLLFNEIEDVVGSRMLSALGINNTIELVIQAILEL